MCISFILLYMYSFLQWASDWLLFNTKWANIKLYHGDNNLHFDEMIVIYTLY